MRNFVAGFVASVAWMMGACLHANALVIDDFEEGPFSLSTSSSTTITISGLPAEHVARGERRVMLSGRSAHASLSLSEGDDRVTVSGGLSDDLRYAGFSIQLTYSDLGGVDLTSGGSQSTLVVAGSGAIFVTIDGQTLSTSSGRIPLSSFNAIDPTHVDEISIRLGSLTARSGSRSLSDVRTVGPAEVLSQCRADLAEANLALYDTEVALAQCTAAPPLSDADADGEADATDACPDTRPGLPIDGEGCSQSQFCAARRATCRTNDWMNDEPTRKKPGDCVPNKQLRICGASV